MINSDTSINFRSRVYIVVKSIPKGKVMTYGQIAAICGNPQAARIVGGIAHQAPCTNQLACKHSSNTADLSAPRHDFDCDCSSRCTLCTDRCAARQESCRCTNCKAFGKVCPCHDIPWQRVVKKNGSLAEGYPGGIIGHEKALQSENIIVINNKVDIKKYIWEPTINHH